MEHEIGQNNSRKIETDCNHDGFWKLVLLAWQFVKVHCLFVDNVWCYTNACLGDWFVWDKFVWHMVVILSFTSSCSQVIKFHSE